MTIVFTIPDDCDAHWRWFIGDVVRCAEKRSGLPVRVIEGVPDHLKSFGETLHAAQAEDSPGMRHMQATSLLRWPVLLDKVKDWPASDWPIVPLDWDILVCADLRPWLEQFAEFDYCVTKDRNEFPSAPYLIRDIGPLMTFCQTLVIELERHDPGMAFTNDMQLWKYIGENAQFKIGDMSRIRGGLVFDHNYGEESSEHFQMDGDHKRMVFENGRYWFFTKEGDRIGVVALHAWSHFKGEIAGWCKEMNV